MTAPSFSDAAMPAYAALYQPYNDIDIYVEDKTLVGLYETIFRRMLGPAMRVYSVTPLGGNGNVEAEALRLQNDNSRRRFFLTDGDFKWVHAANLNIKDLYRLNCYSVENLAWSYSNIIDVAQNYAPELTRAAVESALPPSILLDFVTCMHPLFVLYAVCDKLDATCTTVQHSVVRLIDRQNHVCDRIAVKKRMRDIYKHLLENHSKSRVKSVKLEIETNIASKSANDGRLISGKDYLIQFLLFVMQDKFRFRGNRNQLLSDILSLSTYDIDPDFSNAARARVPNA